MARRDHRVEQHSRRVRARDGYLYVAVLFTTLIVVASVTAALTVSTNSIRSEQDRGSRDQAIRLAESEIHRLAVLMQQGSWRTDYNNNTFTAWRELQSDGTNLVSQAEVRHRFVDADGDLADDPSDSVELTVHARVSVAEVAVSVQLEPAPEPLGLLNYSITCTDDLQINSALLTCEQGVQVFDDCKTDNWGLLTTPRLEFNGYIQFSVRGEVINSSSITEPSESVVDNYVSQGTQISLAALPLSGSDYLIENALLSPNANPFGAADPNGIYWLDAGGAKVIIKNCRCLATLAIRNASVVEVSGGVVWDYPTSADVILATNGPIEFRDLEAELSEPALSVNFNPTGSPYRGTLSNSTNTDVYRSELRGIVYSNGSQTYYPLDTDELFTVTGAIICTDLWVQGPLQVLPLSELRGSTPPTGLDNPTPMTFVRGTFKRIPSPAP